MVEFNHYYTKRGSVPFEHTSQTQAKPVIHVILDLGQEAAPPQESVLLITTLQRGEEWSRKSPKTLFQPQVVS